MIGTGKVESILRYNGIGFDIDHTFIRYRMRNFIKLMNQAASIYLVSKKNYPQEIFPLDKDEAKRKYKMWFRVVFDHKTGNLLKIGSNNIIMRAYHGFMRLTREEIVKSYGTNPFLENYHILATEHTDFTNLHEFYGASLVPLIAQIVQLKKNGKHEVLNAKNFSEIMKDIKDSKNFNLYVLNSEKLKSRDYEGYFNPKLLTEPRHYIHKTSFELLKKLKELRAQGIKVFIVSNNYFEVSNELMIEAVGKNWIEQFDFIIFEAKKPRFFQNLIDSPKFYTLKGKVIENPFHIIDGNAVGEDKVMLGGNACYINQYMQERVKKDFKILFFGDTIVTDCVYAFDKVNQKFWDIAFIAEELQELENGYEEKEYYPYYLYWGSAILDKNIYSGVDKTIVFEFAEKHAHISFSALDSPECLEFLQI